MVKKYIKEYSIGSTEEINANLNFIRYHTKAKSVREILSQVLTPLAEILAKKKAPCGFIVYTKDDQVVIQCYGFGNIVFSGKNQPLNEVIGAD
jgi:hypothetical protein